VILVDHELAHGLHDPGRRLSDLRRGHEVRQQFHETVQVYRRPVALYLRVIKPAILDGVIACIGNGTERTLRIGCDSVHKVVEGVDQRRALSQINRRQAVHILIADDFAQEVHEVVHHVLPKLPAVHGRIAHQFIEERVEPSRARFVLLRSDPEAGKGSNGLENFKLAHETHIEADHLELADAGLGDDALQRGHCIRQRDLAAGIFVARMAGPSPAVIPQHQHVLLRGVCLDAPGGKIGDGVGAAAVKLARTKDDRRGDRLWIVILLDVVAPRFRPVAVQRHIIGGAVNLRDDIDLRRGTHRFHFIEIRQAGQLQVVVGSNMHQYRPLSHRLRLLGRINRRAGRARAHPAGQPVGGTLVIGL